MSDRGDAGGGRGRALRGRPLGLRREVAILVPAALLLLVAASVFTLFSYRNAVDLLIEERQAEALRVGRRIATAAAGGRLQRSMLPSSGAVGAAVLSTEGTLLESVGAPPVDPLPPGLEPGRETALGPGAPVGPVVAAFLPLDSGRWLRIDLEARVLASQARSLRILTVVVLATDAAITLLLLVFVGRLIAPYETLMARAREAGRPTEEAEDEIEHLLATFEEALDLLHGRGGTDGSEEEIAALQRTLVPSLESGVMLLDPDGRVLALNAVGGALLAVEPPEAPVPAAELLSGQPEILAAVETAVTEEKRIQREECTVFSSAGERDVGLTVHPLRSENSPHGEEPRGFLALFVDLTEVRLRREQAQLSESLERLGALAGGLAHEMRNSLATLGGWLQLLERSEDKGGEAARECLEEIRRETDHLHRVLEDFLSFARPGSVRSEEVDAVAVTRRAAADPALSGCDFEVHAPQAGECLVLGDPQLLERALRNLLHNAAEAGRETGDKGIEMEVRPLGREVEIAVADRGPGVPAEVRKRLFVPFASGRPDGVGLGLALVRRIVELHGGRVSLEDRPGGGTVVRVLLPAVDSVTEGSNPATPPVPGEMDGLS